MAVLGMRSHRRREVVLGVMRACQRGIGVAQPQAEVAHHDIVRLADLEPVERGSTLRPVVARVQSVLLVVDTVNARPGTSGVVRIKDVTLLIAPPAAR